MWSSEHWVRPRARGAPSARARVHIQGHVAAGSKVPKDPGKDTKALPASDRHLVPAGLCLSRLFSRQKGRERGRPRTEEPHEKNCHHEWRQASRQDPGWPLTHTRVRTPAHPRGHTHGAHVYTPSSLHAGHTCTYSRLHGHALAHHLHVHNGTRVRANTQVYSMLKEAAERWPPGLSLGTGRGCALASPHGSSRRPRGASPLAS